MRNKEADEFHHIEKKITPSHVRLGQLRLLNLNLFPSVYEPLNPLEFREFLFSFRRHAGTIFKRQRYVI